MSRLIKIRKRYLIYLEKILKDEHFYEVKKMLNDFGLTLKIEHSIYYYPSDWDNPAIEDFVDDTILCYLYSNDLYDEISYRAMKKDSKILLNSKERADKLFNISQKFLSLYYLKILDKLEKYVYLTGKMIELRWSRDNWDEYNTITLDNIRKYFANELTNCWPVIVNNYMHFSIDGIKVFEIGGHEEYVPTDNSSYTKNYFIKNVRQKTDLIDISEMDWFSKLSDKSQLLVKSGSQFLDKIFTGQLDELMDYTPLLLNFSKALEVEIKDYYDNNFSFIWPIAELILSNESYLKSSQVKGKYHVNKLFSVCKEIVLFKANFSPSGHKPLPYILYYLGLGKDIDEIIGIDGFLSGSEREKVGKEIALINRLFDTANNRNNYMHQTAIESKNEFLLHYFDIFQALNLLATIK